MTDKNTIDALLRVLSEGFNLDELRSLCDQLDIDSENLSPKKAEMIRDLVKRLDREKRIPELLEQGRRLRNRLAWPQLPGERIKTLKQALGKQDSEETDEIWEDLLDYLKQIERQGITEADKTLVQTLESFGEGVTSGAKLVRIWNKERAKQQVGAGVDRDFADLADRLQHGEIVLFLGARHSQPVVDKLAGEARYENFQGSFSEICDYMEGGGRKTLLRRVSDAQTKEPAEDDSAYKALYELLRKVSSPLLLISTAYDSKLEDAFRARGKPKPFKVLSHPQTGASGVEVAGNVLIQDGEGGTPKPCTAEDLSTLAPLENGFSLIYKIRGCFSFYNATPEEDTLTLSERDYFRFAKEIDKRMADYLAAQIAGRSLWFFGHYPDTWEERLLIQAVQDKNPSSALAIQPDPSPFAEACWKSRKVGLCRLRPEEFIEKLAENLDA